KLALQNDPGSEELNAGLAELYFKTGHIRDAVQESQDIIKRDPNNLDARNLLTCSSWPSSSSARLPGWSLPTLTITCCSDVCTSSIKIWPKPSRSLRRRGKSILPPRKPSLTSRTSTTKRGTTSAQSKLCNHFPMTSAAASCMPFWDTPTSS